jgi:very-short-patch-repair endonuclease
MSKGASGSIYEKAKKLREQMTGAENVFWETVRNNQLNGLKFRRQHPLGIYILDFYCHKHLLAIELDGGYHQSLIQKDLDAERDHFLIEQGLQILRFKNEDVLNNLANVLEIIKNKTSH